MLLKITSKNFVLSYKNAISNTPTFEVFDNEMRSLYIGLINKKISLFQRLDEKRCGIIGYLDEEELNNFKDKYEYKTICL